MTVEAGSLRDSVQPTAHLVGRLDAQLPILALLTAWPLRVAGAAAILLGGIGFLLTLLSSGAGAPPVLGMEAKLFIGLVMFAFVILGVLQVFLANSVRRHARWAYVLTIFIGLSVAASRLLDVGGAADILPEASMLIYRGAGWVYLGMAFLAAVLLVASFMRQEPSQAL